MESRRGQFACVEDVILTLDQSQRVLDDLQHESRNRKQDGSKERNSGRLKQDGSKERNSGLLKQDGGFGRSRRGALLADSSSNLWTMPIPYMVDATIGQLALQRF